VELKAVTLIVKLSIPIMAPKVILKPFLNNLIVQIKFDIFCRINKSNGLSFAKELKFEYKN
jgi:hypothetical protein